jgi:pyruvate dehydrogenase E2 component (dihydrolipoamide acetyltransferase)
MPKWGLSMQEGMLSSWHVAEGQEITKGQEIADIETSKITNAFESPVSGLLRRRVAHEGETLPVGALLAVIAPASIADAEIDAFVADLQSHFQAEATAAAGTGPAPQTIEAGGLRINYVKAGDAAGDPIVFIHGFGADLNNWLFNQPPLAERRTTYALDLPGHGGSTKEVGKGDVAALAAAVNDFLAALGVARAHLVGHSVGGAVCLHVALVNPARVASVTAIAPAGLGPEVSTEFVDGFIAATRARKLRPVLEMLVHDPKLVTSEMVENVLKFKRLDGVEAALRRIAGACFAEGRQSLQFGPRLAEIRCPVQVIWGKSDRILPVSQARGLPPSFEVALLDDTGHLPHMERADEVNALVMKLAG